MTLTPLALSPVMLIHVGGDPNDAIHFDSFNAADVLGSRPFDFVEFADGSRYSYQEIVADGFDVGGTAGNDALTGSNIADRLRGDAGDDTLDGGAGDDLLYGEAGDDSYVLDFGAGHDTAVEAAGGTSGVRRRIPPAVIRDMSSGIRALHLMKNGARFREFAAAVRGVRQSGSKPDMNIARKSQPWRDGDGWMRTGNDVAWRKAA